LILVFEEETLILQKTEKMEQTKKNRGTIVVKERKTKKNPEKFRVWL
jgi:hypothetical protein